MKLSPSLLAGDLTDMKRTLEEMDPAVVDLLHMDVMDGHFVPTLSFGEQFTRQVAASTSIPLDVHLMVTHPEREVPKYYDLKPFNITFHLEATHFPIRLAQEIRQRGIRAGVALNPGTSERLLEPLLDHIDFILVMSVEPGFYGQKFIPSARPKVRAIREMVGSRDILIQIDGGISTENIALVAQDGVDICVAGSSSFKDGKVNENVKRLKEAAKSIIVT